MSEELNSELELYGVSPGTVAVIMILVTLFLPVGGVNLVNPIPSLSGGLPPFIYSALWAIFLGDIMSLWYLFNPLYFLSIIWLTIPLSLMNILYIRQILRYFMGSSSRYSVVMVGLLSLIVPTILSLYITLAGFPLGLVIPIPIQFVTGLVLLHKFREPELIAPWSGVYIDWSWWRSERRRGKDESSKIPSFSQRLVDHEADWLEEEW
ncbi:hypothetical protein EU527_10220 [Candidatus Thorarchaeota archaeon]|nr:MAG: hypothetical protein EU527_10220 [Candidatus Thorarchaeota archaeon]